MPEWCPLFAVSGAGASWWATGVVQGIYPLNFESGGDDRELKRTRTCPVALQNDIDRSTSESGCDARRRDVLARSTKSHSIMRARVCVLAGRRGDLRRVAGAQSAPRGRGRFADRGAS